MRIGVIGTGVMGRNHARVVAAHHELVAVSDQDPKAADEAAARHDATAFHDAESLIGSGDVEAVVVSTPTVTHTELGLRALEAGLHVLVEKPIAPDLVSARRLVDAAQDHKRVLAVGHIERHNPVVAFAKEALTAKRFGAPITLSTRRVSSLPGRIRDVGCLLDIGIHDLDVLLHLTDEVPETVYALGGMHQTTGDLEDHANVLLRFPSGVKGAVEVNWLTPRKVRRLAMTCDAAYVECDYIEQAVDVSRSRYGESPDSLLWPFPVETISERVQLSREEPLVREWADFVAACRTGGRPLADGRTGYEALAVATAAMASLRSGRPAAPTPFETVQNEGVA